MTMIRETYQGGRPEFRIRAAGNTIYNAGRDLLSLIARWQERHEQRRQLARLDAHQLHDIGLTRGEVEHEIEKRFWQA
ncbi:DUF1127 domain-containing protein [Oceanibacterium hippocampi]|uniref:YjiS-like domain-containing protein n=1 Tax=Oceanibacterium hippocampi TaxID=745714 RepID=A0A1Y5TWX2_9PROT|nr:DUF1127 domain-containing protein [Oceanibacterium hippocampi]SLN74365.1 hypothetical protein OCH7691_03740 [Oceanibacterium hippocampi]